MYSVRTIRVILNILITNNIYDTKNYETLHINIMFLLNTRRFICTTTTSDRYLTELATTPLSDAIDARDLFRERDFFTRVTIFGSIKNR